MKFITEYLNSIKYIIASAAVFIAGEIRAADSTLVVYRYMVSLADKKGTIYTEQAPEQFLSKDAADRRKKFGIAITEQDYPVNENYVTLIDGLNGIRVVGRSKWFNAVLVETPDTSAVKQIPNFPFVSKVQLMGRWKRRVKTETYQSLSAESAGRDVNDTEASLMVNYPAGTDSFYGKGWWQIAMLNGQRLHSMGYNGRGVKVGVLDAGFERMNKIRAFDSLFSTGRVLGWKDFVAQDTEVFKDDNHGLNVVSCMAAYQPGRFVGTAPGASYLLLRSEDADTEFPVEEFYWVMAAEYADSCGVQVINSSLGYTTFDDPSMDHNYSDADGEHYLISRAAQIAESKGILMVNSAGNEGDGSWKYVSAPADAGNVLSIGAVGYDERIAYFSSNGPTADGRTKPDICAMGYEASVLTPRGYVAPASGTSFASPIMAGMVTCLVQAHPDKTPAQIREALRKSGDRTNIPDNRYGYGIPDFYLAHLLLSDRLPFSKDTTLLLSRPYQQQFRPCAFQLYSGKKQTITVRVRRQGKRNKTVAVVKANAGEFVRFRMPSQSTGTYQVTVMSSKKVIDSYRVFFVDRTQVGFRGSLH